MDIIDFTKLKISDDGKFLIYIFSKFYLSILLDFIIILDQMKI